MTTRPVSLAGHKKLGKIVQENAAWLASVRRDALVKIKTDRHPWARGQAIEAYIQAREQHRASVNTYAAACPEKAANWCENARKRHGYL